MTSDVAPGDDWRRRLDDLLPGHELALAPGEYVGGIVITRGGAPGAPVVIRALDPRHPPRLGPSPGCGYVVDVRADDVVIRGLHFSPTSAGLHAVILRGASRVTVEDCGFEGIGGLAIVETMDARTVVVRRNRIRRSSTTALYFGCHSGSCSVTDLLIEDNHIHGVSAPWRGIGYGIQVKLNSCATIRRNVVVDTKGPGIMIYGAQDLALVSLVEGNFAAASRRSSGIVVGGGPVIVRDNVVVGHSDAGIALEDYGGRGLLRSVEVSRNTVHGNRRGGIRVRGVVADAAIEDNRVYAPRGTPALPSGQPGIRLAGNVSGDSPP